MSRDEITVRTIADPRRIARKMGKGAPTPAQPQQPSIQPDTLRSRSTARVLELLSEGPVSGLHYGRVDGSKVWRSVFLDDTPVQDEAGNFQFQLYNAEFRYGFPDQDPIPGWPVGEAEFGVGVECKYHDPVVRRVNTPISAIRYKIRLQSLFHAEQDGDVTGHHVAYAFDYRVDGGPWTNAVTEQIAGKTVSVYERQVRVALPFTAGVIDVRIERLSPDETTSEFQNRTFFSSYTEIIDGQINYSDSSVVAVALDAEEFQTLPRRAYLLDGVCVMIPTNYDGYAHSISGDWDGTFKVAWTNNPAWLLYAMLTNTRWGVGNSIDAAAVDKWSFYEAALWNDQPCADGKGAIEVRYTLNCVINTRQDAFGVLQALASNMLATLYYANGTIMLVQDRRLYDPERLFTNADVENGIFDYTSADVRARHTAVAVTWNDPENKYEATVELVQDPALVARYGYRDTQVTYFGCTSRGQAQRFGRWLIYTAHFETEVVTFRTGLENADVRPGQLIAISDPSRVGARIGGRLLANDAINLVTLDKFPEEMRADPTAWSLLITVGSAATPDNPPRVYYLGIAGIDGSDNVMLTKPEPLPAGSMWVATSTAVVPRQWRVNAIADRDGVYEIVATEYHVEKWDYVDNSAMVPLPPFSLVPSGPLLPPSDLTFKEFIYLDGSGLPQFGIVLSWLPSSDPRITHYQIELQGPADDTRIYRRVFGVSQEVLAMRQGVWTVFLSGYDQLGRRSQTVVLTFTPIGLTEPPLPPEALFITAQQRVATLNWVPTGEIDVMYYWIKWHPSTDGSATWPTATTSISMVDRNTTQITTPTRSGTFMVKTIDSLGQESAQPAVAILVEQITDDVHVDNIVEQTDWGGNLGTNWHRSLGELLLPPPEAPEPVDPALFQGHRNVIMNQTPTRLGTYLFEDELDLGIVCSVSAIALIEGHGAFIGTTMSRWLPLASAVPLASGVNNSMSTWRPLAMAQPLALGASDQWDAHIDVRVSQDGTTFDDWTPLKSAVLTGRRFQFQMHGMVYDLSTTARISRAEVWIEIPLRNIGDNDVPLDGTGHLTITYAVPFLETPTVQITARQGLAPGGNIVLTASTPDHFTVEHRDASGTAVAGGSIDYFVQGFGGGIPLALAA